MAIICRTGHVWHPSGKPSGLARKSGAPAESKPTTAACFAVLFRNSLLVVALICTPKAAYKIHQANREKSENRNSKFEIRNWLCRDPQTSASKTEKQILTPRQI
ncbi:MAG: hypothetical protein DMG39_02210 [Acidobacteria bacterium]|nr:MAG: hypothetical protein DMG39_02210 [Acidobacteriota bacterium]